MRLGWFTTDVTGVAPSTPLTHFAVRCVGTGLEERLGVLLPAEMRPDSSINDAVFFGTPSGPSPRRATKKSRSSSTVRSSSWKSTASFGTACAESSELQSAAPISA
jgi:hypothetical protein